MGSFWAGFEKRAQVKVGQAGMDKEAAGWLSLPMALATHVGQNAGMHRLLRNKKFSKNLAKHFQEGFQAKKPGKVKQFFSSMGEGATIPETTIMKDHMRGLGSEIAESLKSQGVTHLTPRDMALGRALTQGGFSKLTNPKYFDPDSQTHRALLDVFNKKTGVNVTPDMIQKAQKTKDPQIMESLTSMEKAWKREDSPLTSNVFSGLTKNTGKAKQKVPESTKIPDDTKAGLPDHGTNLAGGTVGAGAAGVADIGMGASNMSKVLLSNPKSRNALSKTRYGKRFLDWSDKKFLKDPISQSAEAGKAGKTLTQKQKRVRNYAFNPVTGEAANTANILSHTGASTPVGRSAIQAEKAYKSNPAARDAFKRVKQKQKSNVSGNKNQSNFPKTGT